MSQTSQQGKAASTSWRRANILAAASGIPASKTRSFVAMYRDDEEAPILYKYLDSNPSFNDSYGKQILESLARHMRQGRRQNGQSASHTAQRVERKAITFADTEASQEPKCSADIELLFELRELQRTYGEQTVREAFDALVVLQN